MSVPGDVPLRPGEPPPARAPGDVFDPQLIREFLDPRERLSPADREVWAFLAPLCRETPPADTLLRLGVFADWLNDRGDYRRERKVRVRTSDAALVQVRRRAARLWAEIRGNPPVHAAGMEYTAGDVHYLDLLAFGLHDSANFQAAVREDIVGQVLRLFPRLREAARYQRVRDRQVRIQEAIEASCSDYLFDARGEHARRLVQTGRQVGKTASSWNWSGLPNPFAAATVEPTVGNVSGLDRFRVEGTVTAHETLPDGSERMEISLSPPVFPSAEDKRTLALLDAGIISRQTAWASIGAYELQTTVFDEVGTYSPEALRDGIRAAEQVLVNDWGHSAWGSVAYAGTPKTLDNPLHRWWRDAQAAADRLAAMHRTPIVHSVPGGTDAAADG